MAAAALLAVGSAIVLLQPAGSLRVVAPALDLALDTIAMVVTLVVTMLAWVRYLERRDVQALYQAAAFFSITMANVAAVATSLSGHVTTPLASGEPGPSQVYVFVAGRLLGALLLVVGSVRPVQDASPRIQRLLPAASAAMMFLVVALVANEVALPLFVVYVPNPSTGFPMPHLTPLGLAAHLLASLLFLAAALLTRARAFELRQVGDRYFALAYVFAAFALLHQAVDPGTHPGPVTSGDLLWFAFYLILLMAIEAEAKTALYALRRANRELADLRQADLERAAMAERERLSRELHDGLAQDLWLAKLKVSRLGSLRSLDPEARILVDDLADAVEKGLAEARQAVIATRQPVLDGVNFGRLLRQYLEDHADRFGLVLTFEGPEELPELPPRTQAEVLRMAQEALNNVRWHAEATQVVVRTEVGGGSVAIAVIDNGKGFDPATRARERFGVSAMHERAALVGGRLEIHSRPGQGTRVEIRVPLSAAPLDALAARAAS